MLQLISDGKLSEQQNWNRNQTLVDFSCIPDTIREEIIRKYKNEKSHRENKRQEISNTPGQGMFTRVSTYFTNNNLNNLMDLVEDFI